jgi:hypothetical protein
MTTEWNKKGKPTQRGVYRVGSGKRAIPGEHATPMYAYWSAAGWGFTAPTVKGAMQFCGSKSAIQDRAWREVETEPVEEGA